jgi:hypothetical protein
MSLRGKRFGWVPAIVVASFGLAGLQGCEEEGPMEEAGEEIDDAADEAGDEIDDAVDDIEDDIDDAEDDIDDSAPTGG